MIRLAIYASYSLGRKEERRALPRGSREGIRRPPPPPLTTSLLVGVSITATSMPTNRRSKLPTTAPSPLLIALVQLTASLPYHCHSLSFFPFVFFFSVLSRARWREIARPAKWRTERRTSIFPLPSLKFVVCLW